MTVIITGWQMGVKSANCRGVGDCRFVKRLMRVEDLLGGGQGWIKERDL